jgi:Mn2+/Fe2+ NRAMP family transporter
MTAAAIANPTAREFLGKANPILAQVIDAHPDFRPRAWIDEHLHRTRGWPSSLSSRPRDARGFYGIIVGATVLGMLFNFAGFDPISALFWTAVINGFLAPPLLVLVMLVANDRRVLGERVNGRWLNVLGWGTTLVMFAAAAGLVVTWAG